MSTAFGPQGPNYATTRPPADPQASQGADTFFKNCSSAGAKDGTFATADFFNVNLANLRYLVRQAGILLNDADDTMVYQAVKAVADAEIARLVTPPTGGGSGGGTTVLAPATMVGFLTAGATSWTCPAGITRVRARVIGGGGGGGSCLSSPGSYYGGSGGGGGVAEGYYVVVPGTTYSIVIGVGGAGQTSTGGGNGAAGGTSSFAAFCSATGGSGGMGWGSPLLQGGISGVGSGGQWNGGLGDGSTGGKLDDSNPNYYAPGIGGGPGGQAGAGSGNPGWPGRGPGGGGGGTSRAEIGSQGGNGAPGGLILEY